MDEFFAGAEVEQQKQFIDKYVTHISFPLSWQFWSFEELLIVTVLPKGSFDINSWEFLNICRYNFDPVNDKPLPGRYEWEKVDS